METYSYDAEAPPKQLFFHPELCVGCHLCSYACSTYHDGILSKKKTAIRIVKSDGHFEYPIFCVQCEDKTCMKVCPTDALVWNKAVGTVELVDDKCIHCGLCAVKCDYNVIAFGEDKEVVKCNLCGGAPNCVPACPTAAITFEDSSIEKERAREALARSLLPRTNVMFNFGKKELGETLRGAIARDKAAKAAGGAP